MLALFAALSLSDHRLRVVGTDIVTGYVGSTATARVRGVSCSWHNWWPQFHTASTVDGLKTQFHANVVRTFIGVEKENGYLTNKQKAMDCCYAVIDECIKQNIYGIANFAAFQLHLKEATDFFTAVAGKYKNSEYIIYELMNEPESAPWSQIKSYSQSLIKRIRAIDPKNLILVPTPQWDQKVLDAANDPITGVDNIAYTLHIYTATHPKSFQDDTRQAKKKIAIWADENGAMNSDGKGPLDRTGWNSWISFYEELGIPWLGYGTQDTSETCSIFKKTDSFSDLSEWGTLLKQTILKYQ
uniref:Putative glycosyl hydrolase family5 n=1 Tax=uncultured symbiotic protist of Neotermes koshunensis TaxID=403660 RepID=A4UWV6_9EUKA|nr:putative glycosyl hydrolase family5 [uncultured symbiotic protist of Neotermes koshunensis]